MLLSLSYFFCAASSTLVVIMFQWNNFMCVCLCVAVPFAFFAFWLFQLPTNIFLNSLLITISLMKKNWNWLFLSQYINRMMCLNYILRLLSNQHHFFFFSVCCCTLLLLLLSIHCKKIWISYLNNTEDNSAEQKRRRREKKSQFNEQWWWLSSHPILYPLKESILHSVCVVHWKIGRRKKTKIIFEWILVCV